MIRYISWAHDFDSLLSDGIGVELFWSYLEEESLGHLLKFWLAVEGLKKESDQAIIAKYIKCIIKNFLRTSIIELDQDILEEIAAKTTGDEKASSSSKATIFNRAQESVKKLMHSGPYLNFLKSDIYLNYVQKLHDESDESVHLSPPEGAEDNNHENGDSQEWNIPKNAPTNPLLPTVPEEEPIHHVGNTALSTTSGALSTKQLFNTSSKSEQEFFPSYHAMGSVYNPVSRVDSEIQSCSSGAYTTTDDNYSSFTEIEQQHRKKIKRKAKLKQRIIQQDSAHQINHQVKEEEDSRKLIPRPARSGSVPPRPLSPKSFAQVLTERLQNYLDQKKSEKRTFEILNNKLNNIECSTSSGGAAPPPEGFESDQSILDEHVSRIWKDKTPIHARSPGDFAGRPRSPKGGGKWNISASRTLPSSSSSNKKAANGYYDHHSSSALSFHDEIAFGKSSHYLHSSSLHGQERIMEWVNKVSCPSDVYSDEDIRPKSSKSSFSRSNKQSRSEHQHHHSMSANSSSSTAPMPWNTHQQLQEVNRRLLLTTMGPPTTSNKNHYSSSVTYTFSNEPEGMPYRVKIQGHKVTLFQVKNNLPKLGRYRFYFKTKVDGEPCFEEERDDCAFVPVWSEGKIIVQCRDDVV